MSGHRIVSLLASATEIVAALGELEHLVGRSHECDYPAKVLALPICTRPRFAVGGNSREIDTQVKSTLSSALSLYEVLDEVLEQLQPTHILTQTQCDVCAVSLGDVERSMAAKLASRPKVIALQADSLEGIWGDIRRVAVSLGIAQQGEAVVERLRTQTEEVSRVARGAARRPTVACIEWLQPLMAAGNWMPELVEMAGGLNLFGVAGRHSPWMNWEELIAEDPEVIVAIPCGFDLARTAAEMYWLREDPRWERLRAVREDAVYLADGSQFFNRPGPRLLESLQGLTEILHPERFAPKMEGTVWRKSSTIGRARP